MNNLDTTKCQVLESSDNIFFDVDGTLIIWSKFRLKRKDQLSIPDPNMKGHVIKCYPHITHINILKRNYSQGRKIIVWSAGGHKWAKAVIETLKLESYVSLIMDKPDRYCDDIPMDQWYPQRIYLENDFEGSVK